MKSFAFPKSLKTIGNNCFQNDVSLESIVLPATCELIGNYGFSNCRSLAHIVYEGTEDLTGRADFDPFVDGSGESSVAAPYVCVPLDYQDETFVNFPIKRVDFSQHRILIKHSNQEANISNLSSQNLLNGELALITEKNKENLYAIDSDGNLDKLWRIHNAGTFEVAKSLTKPSSQAVAGDVAMYDRNSQKLVIADINDVTTENFPSEQYSPVGVVVVPGTHDVYGDGSCAVMGVTRETDAFSRIWGVNGDIDLIENIELYGRAELPSDMPSWTGKTNPDDPLTNYYYGPNDQYHSIYAPSPYKADGSFNSDYTNKSLDGEHLSPFDGFDGIRNTDILTAVIPAKRDDVDIEYGDYRAACSCREYQTEGTNQGDWYLPVAGEVGYLVVRQNTIHASVEILNQFYRDSNQNGFGFPNQQYFFPTSNEVNSSNFFAINLKSGSSEQFPKYDDPYMHFDYFPFLRVKSE